MGKQELKGSQWNDYHKRNQLQTMQLLQPTYQKRKHVFVLTKKKAMTIQAEWDQIHNIKSLNDSWNNLTIPKQVGY